MKKNGSILLIALALCLVTPAMASAHVLKTDDTIGAVLHIRPDDAPIANTPVTYVLSFQNNGGNFSLKNCDCSISYVTNGKTVKHAPLVASSSMSSENSVTFPQPAVYVFRVTGMPKAGATFEPFMLEYTVRVGDGQASTQPIPPLLWVGIGMGAALILLYANTQDNHKTKPGKRDT